MGSRMTDKPDPITETDAPPPEPEVPEPKNDVVVEPPAPLEDPAAETAAGTEPA